VRDVHTEARTLAADVAVSSHGRLSKDRWLRTKMKVDAEGPRAYAY
jgi:hypothetical protein